MIVNRKRRRKIRADISNLAWSNDQAKGILVFSPNSLTEISWMEARCSSSRVYLTDRRFYEDGIAASLTGDVEIRMGKLDCCQWRSQPISPPSLPSPPPFVPQLGEYQIYRPRWNRFSIRVTVTVLCEDYGTFR